MPLTLGQLKLGIGRQLELVHNAIMSDCELTVDISNRSLMLSGASGSVGQRLGGQRVTVTL